MSVQVSKPNNIKTIDGNGFAIFIDADTNKVMLKDTNGSLNPLEDEIPSIDLDQDNIARVIRIDANDIEPFEGTQKEKIAQFINSLDYDKLETDGEVWVEFDSEPLTLTAFNATTNGGDACLAPDLAPFDLTLYHNGEGTFPVEGDIVYLDAAGTMPFESVTDRQIEGLEGGYLRTNGSGVVQPIPCE